MIDDIDDEATLNMVKEDIEVYQTGLTQTDDLDYLTPEERKELEEDDGAARPDDYNAESFTQWIQAWKDKLSSEKGL